MAGSPFPSNGKAPSSVGLAGNTLIVANKAQDGVRELRSTPANYTSFHVRPGGSLSPPISSIDVPPGSSPLQAYVTPDRKVLISSEETGVFRAFRIGRDGTPKARTRRCAWQRGSSQAAAGFRTCGPPGWCPIRG